MFRWIFLDALDRPNWETSRWDSATYDFRARKYFSCRWNELSYRRCSKSAKRKSAKPEEKSKCQGEFVPGGKENETWRKNRFSNFPSIFRFDAKHLLWFRVDLKSSRRKFNLCFRVESNRIESNWVDRVRPSSKVHVDDSSINGKKWKRFSFFSKFKLSLWISNLRSFQKPFAVLLRVVRVVFGDFVFL